MRLVSLFLFLALATAWAGSSTPGGQIVSVSGSINYINAEKNIVGVGSSQYKVDAGSILMVNGKRGGIKDLTVGMKIEGSAETPHSANSHRGFRSDDSQGNFSTFRMVNAVTDPHYVASSTSGTAASSSYPPDGRGMPPYGSRQESTPIPPERQKELTDKLAGTYWSMFAGIGFANPDEKPKWMLLNADGSITCSWNDLGGQWRVTSEVQVQVEFNDPGYGSSSIHFFRDYMGGRLSVGNRLAPGSVVMLRRIDSPSGDMLAKSSGGSASASATPAATPVPAEIQGRASDVVTLNHGNLVFVSGKEGAGSGFIANMNGATYLITNVHVAAGINDANFKTLDGAVVKGGEASAAVGHDIFRSVLSNPNGSTKPFEIMEGVSEHTSIGDDVVVLGNAEGSGVINTIIGKIVGVGPDLVEIDAQFVPGNSGSPIIHLKTGKVIGVATYTVTRKYDATTKQKMQTPVVRRFGYRLDSVKTWQPVQWQSFYAQAEAMQKVHTLTKDLGAFFEDIHDNKGRVTVERHTNPVLKDRIAQWIDVKRRHLSAYDRQNADENFISFLKIACQADITAMRGRLTYDYFKRQLDDEMETRTEMSKAFEEIIKEIRQ